MVHDHMANHMRDAKEMIGEKKGRKIHSEYRVQATISRRKVLQKMLIE